MTTSMARPTSVKFLVFFGGVFHASTQDIFLESSADAGDKGSVRFEPPGRKFDLQPWKLQTCVEDPKEVGPDRLKDYKDDKHFYLDGDLMVMRVQDKDVASFSSDPRTELRGVQEWKGGHGKHELHALMMVQHVSKKVTIAQVHASSAKSDVRKLVLMLQYNQTGAVFAHVRERSSPYNMTVLEMGNVNFNDNLQFSVELDGSKMDITVNGKHISHEPPYMDDANHYFKAGAYDQCGGQSHCKASDDHVEVKFKQLSTHHG